MSLAIIFVVTLFFIFVDKNSEPAQNIYENPEWQQNRNNYEINNISLGASTNNRAGNIDGYILEFDSTASDSDLTIPHRLGRIPNFATLIYNDTFVIIRTVNLTSRQAIFQTNTDSANVKVLIW